VSQNNVKIATNSKYSQQLLNL